MKKGGGSESTKIIGPSKSVLVYALRIRPRPCAISGVRAKLIAVSSSHWGHSSSLYRQTSLCVQVLWHNIENGLLFATLRLRR